MICSSADGSNTAFSKEYGEHYHSTRDGAFSETLGKHIIPAFSVFSNESHLNILDICFGLGFNTLATIWYFRKHSPKTKLNIFSPELSDSLVASLEEFVYPEEFSEQLFILKKLIKNGSYSSKNLNVELFIGDAREYITRFSDGFFHIVYQDAFSPEKNPLLWTKEYFAEISRIISPKGVLTTYSIALAIRIALLENGFEVYTHHGKNMRSSTICSKSELSGFKMVAVEHKMRCNPLVTSLRDSLV